MSRKTTIIHIISHPVQYYTPMYAHIAADRDMDFRVLYCSKKGLEKSLDTEFGVSVQWDVPLLDNYRYKFLNNHAFKESLDGFFGLFNLGIIREMANAPKGSIIWIHGWNYATHLMALFTAKLYGHRVFMRGDNTADIENHSPNSLKKRFKKFWFGNIVFPLIDTFLAVGNQNKAFFKLFGVSDHKIVIAPHCIDNQRFMEHRDALDSDKKALRYHLHLPLSKTILIFSGKYIEKKRPLDLLNALALLPKNHNIFVVFVGEGQLRGEMETFIADHDLTDKAMLMGFINQSLMPQYYGAADIYIMCSGLWETWGLSTNEAMCFGLPVILSDLVGCADDLVNKNGYIYTCGNYQELAECIETLTALPKADFEALGQQSLRIIKNYSYESVLNALKNAARKEDIPQLTNQLID